MDEPKVQEEKPLRLFIAIPIPMGVKREIEKAQNELRDLLQQSRVSWTRPEQFHLTLRFLGKVEAGRLSALIDAVRGVCNEFAALNLVAKGVGCFPNLRRPRVIWIGVEDAALQKVQLQQRIQAATQPFTTEKPEERFHGHLTVGRVKEIGGKESKSLADRAASMEARSFGEWQAAQVEIIKSELSPDGARHSCIASIPLREKQG